MTYQQHSQRRTEVKRQCLRSCPKEQHSALVAEDTMAKRPPSGLLHVQKMSAPAAAWLWVPETNLHVAFGVAVYKVFLCVHAPSRA